MREAVLRAEEAVSLKTELASAVRRVQASFKGIEAEVMRDALAPVIDTVGSLLSMIEPDWSLEVEAGVGIDLLARTGPGRVIPLGSLSGGEGVVFAAALAVAVVRLINPAMKLLMLEAAEVDSERLPALLTALDEMGSDMDSILVATCHAGATPSPWETVALAKEQPQTLSAS